MTPEELFQQANPGVDINSPEGQAAFQQWQGGQTNPFSPSGTNLDDAANQALLSGATRAAGGGNTYQVQGGNQQGAFGTVGQEANTGSQTQTQQTAQTGTQTQAGTGTQQQVANTTGTTAGNTTTSNTRGVNDTLGFGSLLQGGVGGAQTADASRGTFLQDMVDTGGAGFGQQVDRAVRASQSGPGMQGTGDNAKDRAAGYAAEGVAMDNANQRLNASQQLAGPTATQTLAGAGTPYLGTTDTGTQATTGTQQQTANTTGSTTNNTTGTTQQNSSSLGSLLSSSLQNQSQGGVSSAANTQIAAGNQPEQTTSGGGGGGSVVCSALVERDMLSRTLVVEEAQYIAGHWPKFKQAAKGYYLFGVPLAKQVRKHHWVANLCLPIACACATEAARRGGSFRQKRWFNVVAYKAMFVTCHSLGWFVRKPATIDDPGLCRMLNDLQLHLDLF